MYRTGDRPRRARHGWRLCVWGAVLCLVMIALVRYGGRTGSARYLVLLAAACAAYLGAMIEIGRSIHHSKLALALCLALAAAWRVPLVQNPSGRQDDVYRYMWDARLQRLGYNPYVAIPADPSLAHVHSSLTRQMNNPTVPSPYPPGAQIFFRAVTAVDESVRAFKIALVFCDALIAILLLRWLAVSGRDGSWVLAYAWNPLVALEGAGHGHLDPLGVLFLMIAVLALTGGRRTAAAVAFAMAVAVKWLPIVLVPLFWRRVRTRDAALAIAFFAALYLPYLTDGRLPTGSLGAFVDTFRFNGPIFAGLERIAGPRPVAALAVVAGLAVAVWWRGRRPTHDPAAWAWPMAIALALAPVVYPWYLVWVTPFLTSAATVPLMVWTVTVLATYGVWHAANLGAPWVVPWPILVFEYGVVALVAGWAVWRRRRSLDRERSTRHGAGGLWN